MKTDARSMWGVTDDGKTPLKAKCMACDDPFEFTATIVKLDESGALKALR